MNEREMQALTSELQEYVLKVICVHIVQTSFSFHSNQSLKTSFGQYLNEADHTVHFQQLFCVTKYRVLGLQSSYIHMMEHIYNRAGPQTEKWENLNGTKFFCCL